MFRNGTFAYWITSNEIVVICSPRIYQINGRLHREDGPAVEWPEEKYYFLHGVKFDKDLWQKIVKNEVSGKELLSWKNTEQKMAAIKALGMDKIFQDVGAKLIDKSERGNELYLVESVFSRPAKFVKKICPSTGRAYIEGVAPKIKTADEAVAWQMDITPLEYSRFKIET